MILNAKPQTPRRSHGPDLIRSTRRLIRFSVSALCLCMGIGAVVPDAAAQGEPDSGRIKLGETDLYPSLRLEYGTNDNAYLESFNPEDTSSYAVKPRLIWFASQRSTRIRAEYSGDYANHSESSLDYVNHNLSFQASSVLARQWRVATSGGIQRRILPLGTERTSVNTRLFTEPFTYNDLGLSAVGTFGADGARGNLDFGVRIRRLDPKNQLDLNEDFGYTSVGPFLRFSYRLSGDTRLTLEGRFTDLDYELDFRDRSETAFLAGATFAATGRLTGSFDIGVSTISSDNANEDGDSNVIASADIGYSVSSATLFTLTVARRIDNATAFSADEEDSRIRNTVRLEWDQDYSSRVSHEAYVQSVIVDRTCPFRGFDDLEYSFQLGLSVRRWVQLGGFINNKSRTFDTCPAEFNENNDYNNERLGIFINVTL